MGGHPSGKKVNLFPAQLNGPQGFPDGFSGHPSSRTSDPDQQRSTEKHYSFVLPFFFFGDRVTMIGEEEIQPLKAADPHGGCQTPDNIR